MTVLGNQNRNPGACQTSDRADVGLVDEAYNDIRFQGEDAAAHLHQMGNGESNRIKRAICVTSDFYSPAVNGRGQIISVRILPAQRQYRDIPAGVRQSLAK